ncbi:MAG: glycosyltransferase family 2 protein, partial [Candidatus Eiseniibacteriota bacterium]
MSALGVVISCYRQERYLERTIRALEPALEGRDWHGVLEIASPSDAPLPALSARWTVISSTDPVTHQVRRALTPGAGRMTAFRACGGDWVLFLDSDMQLDRAWVDAALDTAAREPLLAGLGGRIEEWFEDGSTERPGKHDMYGSGERTHAVPYLANVALYRRAALETAGGYNEWLHSDEDFEIGMRLGWLGLELRVLGMRAGRHWSAPRPSFPELGRRWRTGLCFGQGEVLRLYFGRRGMGTLLRRQW